MAYNNYRKVPYGNKLNETTALNAALEDPNVSTTMPVGTPTKLDWNEMPGISTPGPLVKPPKQPVTGPYANALRGGGTSDVTTAGHTPTLGNNPSNPPRINNPGNLSSLSTAGLNGFDHNNFYNPDMQSVKYRFARLAQRAGARTPSQMAALVLSPEFQQEFPGATFDGKDRVNFAGALSDGSRGGTPVNWVDVLLAADRDADSANGIWWGPVEEEAANMGAGSGSASPLEFLLAMNQNGGDNLSLSLDQMLQQLARGNRY